MEVERPEVLDCLGRPTRVFHCEGESKTVQSDGVDADINTIVARFGLTGELPQNLEYVTNLDLSEAPDSYQGAIEILQKAQESFMQLPPRVRSKFQNDPGQFMDFCSDPANLDEMRELGLAVPKKEEPKPVVTPAPEGDKARS